MPDGARRLAAIMFTDTVGSTAAAQANERAALERLREQEKLIRPIFARHGGREVKSTGDGFLVEFESALQATECALEIQRSLHERNLRAGSDTIDVRIGVHLGDVEEHRGDIFGDAVNIAARVEPLADAGGVCISAQVFDQVRNKIPNPFEKLPEASLKGVRVPVEVYRVVLPWAAQRPTEPHSPTRLAVLPFRNMSPDPQDEYFAEGMTEELIATVSKIGGLRVIARTSVMRFADGSKSAAEIARELRVGSLVEGSVRRAGDDLRVTAQLIDVATEEPRWSMSFDRRLENIFAIQQELAQRIAESLEVRLVRGEQATLGRIPTRSVDAFDLYLKGRQRFFEVTGDGFVDAIALFEKAIALDPGFALAHCALAEAQALQGNRGFVPLAPALERAERSARVALRLDPMLGEAHAALAPILYNRYQWNECVGELDRAIALEPSNVQAHFWRAVAVCAVGRTEEGLGNALRAVELDPLNPRRRIILAQQYYWLRQFDHAIEVLRSPLLSDTADTRSMLTYVLFASGRENEAVAEIDREAVDLRTSPLAMRVDHAAIYARAGRPNEARELVVELERTKQEHDVPAGAIGWVHAALGEPDTAADWFTRAHAEGSIFGIPDLAGDPFLDPFRASARFRPLLQLFGLPGAGQAVDRGAR